MKQKFALAVWPADRLGIPFFCGSIRAAVQRHAFFDFGSH